MELNACDIRPEDIPKLPARMRDFVRLIGLAAAVDLVNSFGGTEVSFPRHENANKRGGQAFSLLAAVISRERALILCAEYGGEKIAVPRCHSWRNELRARAIRSIFDGGATVSAIAYDFGITYRAVEQILNRAP